MAEYVVVDKEQLEADLATVADSIREKGGTSEPLAFPNGMADAARALGVDYSRYARTVTFETDDLPPVMKLDLDHVVSLNSLMLGGGNIQEITINCKKPIESMQRLFFNSTTRFKYLKKIIFNVDTSQCTHFTNAFSYLMSVDENDIGNVEIIGELDFTSATSVASIFSGSIGLKDVRFKRNTLKLPMTLAQCSKLSSTSIQSIIDGLATVETSRTLTFHSDVKAKLTEAQISQITSKNWTLA